jgi:anti-sigma factor RsiW
MPLKCEEVQERLSAWLDGELPEEAMAAVEVHLAGCAFCRREVARFRALDEALGALPAPVPPHLAERVLAVQPRPRRPWWQSLALAASLILGIVLGGTLARDFYPLSTENGTGGEVLAMEDFQDFPQGSLGTIVASYQADDGNGS